MAKKVLSRCLPPRHSSFLFKPINFPTVFALPWRLYTDIHIAIRMTSVATTCVIYFHSLYYGIPLGTHSSTRDQLNYASLIAVMNSPLRDATHQTIASGLIKSPPNVTSMGIKWDLCTQRMPLMWFRQHVTNTPSMPSITKGIRTESL